jgi:hypothetical protein
MGLMHRACGDWLAGVQVLVAIIGPTGAQKMLGLEVIAVDSSLRGESDGGVTSGGHNPSACGGCSGWIIQGVRFLVDYYAEVTSPRAVSWFASRNWWA